MDVFCHVNDKTKKDSIRALCRDLGCGFHEFGPEAADLTVLEIVSENRAAASPLPVFMSLPDLILFSSIEEGLFDSFLAEYRKRRIEKTDLKAVVTPYNLRWKLKDLARELRREHELMTGSHNETQEK